MTKETQPQKIDKLWDGASNILDSFDALGQPYDMPLNRYLQEIGKVVVRNDPVLMEVFGTETVEEYERLLANAYR